MRQELLPARGKFYKANLHMHTTISDGELTPEEVKKQGFEPYFVDHTTGVYPQAAAGFPFSAGSLQVKGDPITDLHEDMAADAATV